MGISDKVLDRAFTLEFWDIRVDRWPGWDAAEIEARDKTTVKEVLALLMDALRPARLHFGWRVIADVVQFMEPCEKQSAALSVDHALDRVIYAKVLPKLRGDDSPRFRDALEPLLVEDEPRRRIETGRNEWAWQPGFYAGEVRAELLNRNDRTLGTWRLDVSPDAGKAGRDLFGRMISEIVDFRRRSRGR